MNSLVIIFFVAIISLSKAKDCFVLSPITAISLVTHTQVTLDMLQGDFYGPAFNEQYQNTGISCILNTGFACFMTLHDAEAGVARCVSSGNSRVSIFELDGLACPSASISQTVGIAGNDGTYDFDFQSWEYTECRGTPDQQLEVNYALLYDNTCLLPPVLPSV
eukprot:Phypoly_transcript_24243.p1 GENE.Phypoly_transcript_24243~~Phypoly_transcript_24243.p1  ORF type:complete len:170 (-),score=11.91 Phypoly_transcript_24243:46-534(-)